MKNKLGKVLRTMLLTLTIVLMYSMSVSAASGQASIGNKNYATVQKALNAVQNGQTIKLNQDITLNKALLFKKNVKYTFDMNKHKVTSKVADSDTVGGFDVQSGNVTFTNGTTSAAVFVHEKATVTVKDGTYAQVTNWGKTTIKNGKVVNKDYSAICNYKGTMVINKVTARANYNCIYAEGGTVTVNGGNYKAANSKTTYPLVYSKKATVYLKGGSYTTTQAIAVYNEKGKVTISGGNYGKGNSGFKGVIVNFNSMTIKGGTFTSDNYAAALFCGENSSTVISGGKFTAKGDVVDIYSGRKKLLVNGGTYQGIAAFSFVWNENNTKIDKSKIKLVGSTRYKITYYVG